MEKELHPSHGQGEKKGVVQGNLNAWPQPGTSPDDGGDSHNAQQSGREIAQDGNDDSVGNHASEGQHSRRKNKRKGVRIGNGSCQLIPQPEHE